MIQGISLRYSHCSKQKVMRRCIALRRESMDPMKPALAWSATACHAAGIILNAGMEARGHAAGNDVGHSNIGRAVGLVSKKATSASFTDSDCPV